MTSAPSPAASTSPGWVKPDVRFLSGTDLQGTFEIGGEQRSFAKGDLIYPLNVRYAGIVIDTTATTTPVVTPTPTATSTDTTVPSVTGIFLSGDDAAVGWLVTSNADEPTVLPDAALGKISGRVRAAGSVAGTKDQYSVRVGDRQAVATKVNTSVDGSGLTFNGVSDKRVPTASVFFTDASGVVFFGRFGGGEYDGVWF
ncbi:hypothetical protein [Kineococcus sp. R86509]|uniref:hypothetical protein n=1 Tax=Kineococcus sp. R86509 TaxID=3093851 RepID=UPI0036D257AB